MQNNQLLFWTLRARVQSLVETEAMAGRVTLSAIAALSRVAKPAGFDRSTQFYPIGGLNTDPFEGGCLGTVAG